MAMFCRHNRLTAHCTICRKELEAALPSAPSRPRTTTRETAKAPAGRASGTSGRTGRLVTRKLARAVDDGYRNPLVPGLKATADAERLAAALTAAARRLEPPGPHQAVVAEPDKDEATWLAFLLALVGPDAEDLHAAIVADHPTWASGDAPELPGALASTADAYRAWAERAGGQVAAFEGEAGWTPPRRFGRVFERLALPGFGRGPRYELLNVLGAAGLYALRADALRPGSDDDATTLAAKRLLVSGDRMLLDRRARDLAEATEVPVGALDRGLATWGDPAHDVPDVEIGDAMRRALKLG